MSEAVEAFALLVDEAGKAVRLTALAEQMPQAHMPEARETIEQLRLERAAALASVAVFALRHAAALAPELAPPTPPRTEGVVSYTLGATEPPPWTPVVMDLEQRARRKIAETTGLANPFLAFLGAR